MIAHSLILFVLPAILLAAAAWDLASFTIPNAIQILLLSAFVIFAIALHMALPLVGMHLLAGFIGLAVGFVLFGFGFIGGGDAKLFACAALWFGISDLAAYALMASIFGGALTLGLLAARGMPLPAILAKQNWLLRLHDEKAGIPYGVALAAGAFFVLPYAEVFRTAIGA